MIIKLRIRTNVPQVKQVWFADDATGAGTCESLRKFWDNLLTLGTGYGYYPNGSKTYLVVKPEHIVKARELFADTDVNITTEGKRHLGAAIGTRDFIESYVAGKVKKWVEEIHQLSEIAQTQPHAAYCAYTHGLSSRWTYLSRTIPDISTLLQPLEDAIHQYLIPALTGRPPCSDEERDLLALPVRLGGMGISNPTQMSSHAFESSVQLTTPLVTKIIEQNHSGTVDIFQVIKIKSIIHQNNRSRQSQHADSIKHLLSPQLQRQVDLAKEKGASSWLSVLPLDDHGFHLHKRAFRDAICLRLIHLVSVCHSNKVQLWQYFLCHTCHDLPQGRLPNYPS